MYVHMFGISSMGDFVYDCSPDVYEFRKVVSTMS